jgi:hypothetical protein
MTAKEVDSCQDKSGCAEAALERLTLDKGTLHRVQFVSITDALDCRDLMALCLNGQEQA